MQRSANGTSKDGGACMTQHSENGAARIVAWGDTVDQANRCAWARVEVALGPVACRP